MKRAEPTAAASRVETETYVVALSAQPNQGRIVIAAKPPLHVNPEYPTSFRPEGHSVQFASERVRLEPSAKKPCAANPEDACETTSSFEFTGVAGAEVAGTLQFSVCEPAKCLIEKVTLRATVEP